MNGFNKMADIYPHLRYGKFSFLALSISVVLVCLFGAESTWAQQTSGPTRIDLPQAIQLALAHNHALKAARTLIEQSHAEEVTAAIRPNPVLTYDDLFVPLFSPSQLNSSAIDTITEFDLGVSYTFERGRKRQARMRAAQDQTAVTRAGVQDNERSLTFNVAQQFLTALLA